MCAIVGLRASFLHYQCFPQGLLSVASFFALRFCYGCALSKYPGLFLASIPFKEHVKSLK